MTVPPLNIHEALVVRHMKADKDEIIDGLHDAMKAARLAAERATRIVAQNLNDALRTPGANQKAARDLSIPALAPALRVLDAATAATVATIEDLEKFLAGSPNATPATRERIERLEGANLAVVI